MKKTMIITLCGLCALLLAFSFWFADSPASAEVSQETKGVYSGLDAKQANLTLTSQGTEQTYRLASSVWVSVMRHCPVLR